MTHIITAKTVLQTLAAYSIDVTPDSVHALLAMYMYIAIRNKLATFTFLGHE